MKSWKGDTPHDSVFQSRRTLAEYLQFVYEVVPRGNPKALSYIQPDAMTCPQRSAAQEAEIARKKAERKAKGKGKGGGVAPGKGGGVAPGKGFGKAAAPFLGAQPNVPFSFVPWGGGKGGQAGAYDRRVSRPGESTRRSAGTRYDQVAQEENLQQAAWAASLAGAELLPSGPGQPAAVAADVPGTPAPAAVAAGSREPAPAAADTSQQGAVAAASAEQPDPWSSWREGRQPPWRDWSWGTASMVADAYLKGKSKGKGVAASSAASSSADPNRWWSDQQDDWWAHWYQGWYDASGW